MLQYNDTYYYYYTIRWFVVRSLSWTLFMVIPNARFKRFRRRHISTVRDTHTCITHTHTHTNTYINRILRVPLGRRCRCKGGGKGVRRCGTSIEIPFGRGEGCMVLGIVKRTGRKTRVYRIIIIIIYICPIQYYVIIKYHTTHITILCINI